MKKLNRTWKWGEKPHGLMDVTFIGYIAFRFICLYFRLFTRGFIADDLKKP